MSEQELVAPSAATEEAVPVIQDDVSEATENTEGQDNQPAEAEKEAEERKTRSQERRERRKQHEQRLAEEHARAIKERDDALAKSARILSANKGETPPKEADYPSYAEYEQALNAFTYAQVADKRRAAEISAEAEEHGKRAAALASEEMRMRKELFDEQAMEARSRYADFDTVMAMAGRPDIVADHIAEMVLQSEQSVDLAYHLGSNPALARQISQLSPIAAARELGRLEARLSVPQARTQSTAPAPISPVKGGAAPAEPDGSDFNAWVAAREKGWKPTR